MPVRRRRRTHRRRRRGGKSLASKAYRLARKAYNSTDHELKFLNNTFDAVDVSGATEANTTNIFPLNLTIQGIDDQNRIGDKIIMKSVEIRLLFTAGTNSGPAGNVGRVMLIYDRQTNGGLSTVQAMLENAASTNQRRNLASPYNVEFRLRFRVLMDRRFRVSAESYNQTFFLHRKYLRHQTQYNGAGGAIGNIHTGSLVLVIIGDQVVGGGTNATVDGQVFLRYIG